MHGRLLALLTLAFALRVIGQAWVEFFGVGWLPRSEAWASGLLPYPLLLTVQILLLAVMSKIVIDASAETGSFVPPRPRLGHFLLGLSKLYAAAMALRYGLTMIFVPEMRWLGGAIPIFFHFVLAAFLYTWGRTIFARSHGAC